MRGAEALVEMLRAEGLRYVFGNPGTSESAIMWALEQQSEIEYVLATQEGVANGISLLTNAREAGTPLVLSAGNKDVRKLAEGRIPLERMVEPFTKWSAEITHPEQVPSVVRRAFQEAKTPPTAPVFLSFAANALDDHGEMEIVPSDQRRWRPGPDPGAIEETGRILAAASHPVLIVGDGITRDGAQQEAARFAEVAGARVYTTGTGGVSFPAGHPQFQGLINPSMAAGRRQLAAADAVVLAGASVGGYFYSAGRAFPPGAELIHIDKVAGEIGRSEPTAVGIVASPAAALGELARDVASRLDGEEREAVTIRTRTVAREREAQRDAWQERVKARWDLSPMSSERMMTELARALPEDVLVVDDSITSRSSLLGAINFNDPEQLL